MLGLSGFVREVLDRIRINGLEYFGRYYATYNGTVVSNADPGGMGRILVKVPSVAGEQVLGQPAMPESVCAGANHGFYFPPEKGEGVTVWFENGDPRFPWYRGGWWGTTDDAAEDQSKSELPSEFKESTAPAKDWSGQSVRKRGIKIMTEDGKKYFLLRFDKKQDEEQILLMHPTLSHISMDKDGSIQIRDKKGNSIFFNAKDGEFTCTNVYEDNKANMVTMSKDAVKMIHGEGSWVECKGKSINIVANGAANVQAKNVQIDAGGIYLGKSATEPIVLGNQLKTYLSTLMGTFNAHVHGTGVGPSTPPVSPLSPIPDTAFSQQTKAKLK